MSVYHSTYSFGSGKIKKLPFINDFMHTYSIPNSEIKVIKESLLKASKVLFSGGPKIYILLNLTRLSRCLSVIIKTKLKA